MKKSGVKTVFFRIERQVLQRTMERLAQFSGASSPAGQSFSGNPVIAELRRLKGSIDAFVLTQGGLYDALTVNGLCEFLSGGSFPYFLNVRSGRGYAGGAGPTERALSAKLFTAAKGLVVPARANENNVFDELAVRCESSTVIHSPVKNRSTTIAPLPAGNTIRFACVSRLEAVEKGLDLLVLAVARIREHPVPFEVSIYGSGPDKDYLRELIAHLRVGGKVHLRGPYHSLDDVWSHHHACLLPSRSEGMPQTLMEAMFAGRPSVATPIGGVPDLVDDGATGFLANASSAEAVSIAISRCLSAVSQLPDIGLKARQHAVAHLNNDVVGDFCAFVKRHLRV
jgi:glycosyltransferase involved in cell wall biosynthesis